LQVESLSLRNKLQGALPLVDHFLRALQLRPLLGQQICPPHYVDALEMLIKSVLLQPNASTASRSGPSPMIRLCDRHNTWEMTLWAELWIGSSKVIGPA